MANKLDWIELKQNPPIIDVKKLKGKKEIIFTMVSCMCNNISYIRFKKNQEGEFRLNAYITSYGYCYSNYQIKHTKHEVEWSADEDNWAEVIRMVNTGTSVIGEVISR
jgi:hypothetical protein